MPQKADVTKSDQARRKPSGADATQGQSERLERRPRDSLRIAAHRGLPSGPRLNPAPSPSPQDPIGSSETRSGCAAGAFSAPLTRSRGSAFRTAAAALDARWAERSSRSLAGQTPRDGDRWTNFVERG